MHTHVHKQTHTHTSKHMHTHMHARRHTRTHTHWVLFGPGVKLISPYNSHRRLPSLNSQSLTLSLLTMAGSTKKETCERAWECERGRVSAQEKKTSERKHAKSRERERVTERDRHAIVSHQVRSKVCIFDAELGLSILARRRALETVTMTTRHSTTALTCRQRTTASTRDVPLQIHSDSSSHVEGGEFTLLLRLQEITSQ